MRKLFLILIILLQAQACFGAADFNATNSVLTCGTNDDIMAENTARTISAWIYPKSSGEGNAGTIIDRGTAGTSSNGFRMSITNAMLFQVNGGTTLSRITSTGVISYNQWHHVLMTWDGSTTAANVHIYIDLVEPSYATTTNGVTPANNSGTNTRIGNRSSNAATFDGYISELAYWDSILPMGDIIKLGSSRTRGMPFQVSQPPIRYWSLDDLSTSEIRTPILNRYGIVDSCTNSQTKGFGDIITRP